MRARPPLRVPRRRAVRVSARAWIVMFTCCHVVMLSCLYVIGRHSLGTTVLKQKGAVIREKRFNIFIADASLVDTRSVIFIRNARLRVSKETSKQDRYEKQRFRGF